nr:hypothetical protein pmam_155 [Pithovirus mammoth]
MASLEALCSFSQGVTEKQWMDAWRQGLCTNLYYSQIYSSPSARINPAGLDNVRRSMYATFLKYVQNYQITEPGREGYSPFQETLLSSCSQLPGSCDLALTEICGLYSNRSEIESSPSRTAFCGCFAPEIEGPLRSYLLTPSGTYNRPCDPLCSRAGTVQRIRPDGEVDICQGDVCVISGANLQIEDSSVPFVNFTQVCRCQPGTCRCIFNAEDTNSLISRLGLGASFRQVCGPESLCLQTDANGNNTVVECNTQPLNFPVPFRFYVAVAIIVIGLILFACIYAFLV